jgi:hypothetical protein
MPSSFYRDSEYPVSRKLLPTSQKFPAKSDKRRCPIKPLSMNAEAPQSPPPTDDAPLKLPDLNTTELDAALVEQLLRDIEVCTQITEIIPKFARRGQVPDTASVTLTQARELLATRAVRGLQLRYRYDNADWWDTLMVVGEGFRLVRIRHDFATDASFPMQS